MIPTFPEIRAQLFPLLVLLACVAALGTRVDVTAHAVSAPQERNGFNPFTDHAGLPAGLTWLVQVERPAAQIESEQGRSLAAAIAQTDLMAQTGKAWSRLARTLGGEEDAFDLLGERVQFVAGSLSVGQPWAVSIEIDAGHREHLLARLKAFPRLHRNRRPISELEDGRYLLAVFDRGERAVVLLAPRSDRSLRPEEDPETALFFEMFDRLSGVAAAGHAPNTLAAPLGAVGAGEILIARRVSSLSWNPLDGSVTIEDRDAGAGADDSGFVALRLDRAAGGWAGRLAVSDRDGAPDAAGAALSYERLGDALPTISWVSLSPGFRSVLPGLAAQASPLPVWLPAAGDGPGWAALLRPEAGARDAKPSVAYVQRVDAVEGPARFDAAVAAVIRAAQPGIPGPDHAGEYPGAVRAQPVETATWLGPRATVVWGYSEPNGSTRTAAMLISPDRGREGPDTTERALRALFAADGGALAGDAPVSAGRLRLAELVGLYRAFVAPGETPDPLLSRIESVVWSLHGSEIGGVSSVIGPVSVTLTPSRQGGLGSK